VDPVSPTTDGFKNDLVTKYYRVCLASVDNLNISYDVGYSKANGLKMSLTGNFADQFINSLKAIVMEIGKDAKEAALARLSKELNESENEFIIKTKEFFGIEGDIDLQNVRLADIQNLLEKKQKEVENWLKDQANKAIEDAKEKATEFVQEKTSEVKQQVTDSLKDSLGNVFGTPKKTEEKTDGEDEKEDEEKEDSKDKLSNGLMDIGKGLFGR
jgi:CHAD domain-containing protein